VLSPWHRKGDNMQSHMSPLVQHLWLFLQAVLSIVASFGFSFITQLLQTIFVTWVLQQWADWRRREANPVTLHLEEEVIARTCCQWKSKKRELPASLLSEQFLTVSHVHHVPE
jgi:hypothetical protein